MNDCHITGTTRKSLMSNPRNRFRGPSVRLYKLFPSVYVELSKSVAMIIIWKVKNIWQTVAYSKIVTRIGDQRKGTVSKREVSICIKGTTAQYDYFWFLQQWHRRSVLQMNFQKDLVAFICIFLKLTFFIFQSSLLTLFHPKIKSRDIYSPLVQSL